jgi:hypothetical protein
MDRTQFVPRATGIGNGLPAVNEQADSNVLTADEGGETSKGEISKEGLHHGVLQEPSLRKD